jgi:hypothetical protein
MKLSLVALAFALLSACKPSHVSTPRVGRTEAAADLESKTVALVQARLGEARAYCSGVWVAPDAILTAAHCMTAFEVGDAIAYVTRADLDRPDSDSLTAVRFGRYASLDQDRDLALVRVKGAPEHNVAQLGGDPEVGSSVQTMGHPLGLWYSYSTGNVAAVRADGDGTWYVQSTAPISPGNSGGGLFDGQGRLLGLCHAYMPKGENLNLYVHITHVRAFLSVQL